MKYVLAEEKKIPSGISDIINHSKQKERWILAPTFPSWRDLFFPSAENKT